MRTLLYGSPKLVTTCPPFVLTFLDGFLNRELRLSHAFLLYFWLNFVVAVWVKSAL